MTAKTMSATNKRLLAGCTRRQHHNVAITVYTAAVIVYPVAIVVIFLAIIAVAVIVYLVAINMVLWPSFLWLSLLWPSLYTLIMTLPHFQEICTIKKLLQISCIKF